MCRPLWVSKNIRFGLSVLESDLSQWTSKSEASIESISNITTSSGIVRRSKPEQSVNFSFHTHRQSSSEFKGVTFGILFFSFCGYNVQPLFNNIVSKAVAGRARDNPLFSDDKLLVVKSSTPFYLKFNFRNRNRTETFFKNAQTMLCFGQEKVLA